MSPPALAGVTARRSRRIMVRSLAPFTTRALGPLASLYRSRVTAIPFHEFRVPFLRDGALSLREFHA